MYATQQLRDEHEGIKVVLSVLEQLAGDLERGKPVETDDLASILDFLRTFADKCHHGKEEDLLFPALEAIGLPSQGGPVGVMLFEHTQGRACIRGMAEALDGLQAGRDTASAFAANAIGYVNLLRGHINKENMILFAIAEDRLPAEEHQRLAAAFERVEQEKIGAGAHEHFHALIDTLAAKYLGQLMHA